MTAIEPVSRDPVTLGEEQKRAQKKTWSASAAAWDRWYEWYVAQFQPVFDWCCDAIRVAPGMRVLDIACGVGQPTFTIARRVGPSGEVVAADFSPEMLAVAERRARSLGVANVEFKEMDAERLDVPDASFDAMTCVCGLMFCPDPARALSEIRRALKPGGRFAIVAWDDPSRNQFAGVASRAAVDVLKAPPPAPNAPQAFRFQRDDLERLLQDAGFRDVVIESRPGSFHYDSVEQYLELTTDLAGALKAKLMTLPAADVERFRALARENAAPYVTSRGLELSATPMCASGHT